MSQPTIVDKSVQHAKEWFKELSDYPGIGDEQRAYQALRASLQELRDRLTVEEAADLGAQLPTLIRGIYYETYDPAKSPTRKHREAFLQGVSERIDTRLNMDPEAAVTATFALLSRHVTSGELEDVRHMLPKDLRSLWPDVAA